MIAPSTSPNAQRIFTNRDTPKKLFDAALSGLRDARSDRYHVLTWYGEGGQGKSALREEFRLQIERQRRLGDKIALAELDFETAKYRDPVEALLELRLQLGRELAFPTFDVAFAQLFAQERPGADLRSAHPGLFTGHSGGTADLLDVLHHTVQNAAGAGMLTGIASLPGAALVPHLGLLPAAGLIYKYANLLAGGLRSWWGRRDVRAHVNEIQNLRREKLREQLPVYFGSDVRRALAADDRPCVVILIDTYEALWRDRAAQGSMQTLRADQWVRAIVQETKGALVAIFARDKLRWSEIDRGWDAVLDQHRLYGLSDNDANWYLTAAGISAPEIRARIVMAANGLPFYLDLARLQHEQIKAEGREPVVDDFADAPTEVIPRFFDHLSESELEELRLASYVENIDEAWFGKLCAEFRGGAACGDWPRLAHRTYMLGPDGDRPRMHAMLRDELQKRERRDRPLLYRKVHTWLSHRFEDIVAAAPSARAVDETHDSAFLAAARHVTLADPGGSISWLLEPRHRKLYDAGRWRALAEAIDIVEHAVDGLPSPSTDKLIWFNHHRGHVYQSIGLDRDAHAFFAAARDLHRRELNDQTPEYATIVHALADTCRRLDKEAEAELLYAEVLRIYAANPAVFTGRRADAMLSLALLDEAAGRSDEADRTRWEAQEILATTAGARDSSYGDFLLKLGRLRRGKDRDADAEQLFAEALTVYTDAGTGARAEGFAAALLDLAECLAARGARPAARSRFEQALAIYDEALGQQHPNYGRALHLLSRFRLDEPAERAAAVTDLERAVAVLAASLGDEHPWTQAARLDLQRAAAR